MLDKECEDLFKKAEFHSTHVTAASISSATRLYQAAFLGRSNAGKSSLINAILNRKSLVKVSANPGKTRTINLFYIGENFLFADLPGFGYARVSKKERKTMLEMIFDYINHVEELKLVFVLCDSARVLPDEEKELISFCYTTARLPVLVWTKTDHIKKEDRARLRKESQKIKGIFPNLNIIHSSSKLRQGISEIQKLVCEVMTEN